MFRVPACALLCALSLVVSLFAAHPTQADEVSGSSLLFDTQPVAVVFSDADDELSSEATAFHLSDFQDPPTPNDSESDADRRESPLTDDELDEDLAPVIPPPAPSRRRERRFESLASVPNMFGDFFGLGGAVRR